jgi:hypothetical protein
VHKTSLYLIIGTGDGEGMPIPVSEKTHLPPSGARDVYYRYAERDELTIDGKLFFTEWRPASPRHYWGMEATLDYLQAEWVENPFPVNAALRNDLELLFLKLRGYSQRAVFQRGDLHRPLFIEADAQVAPYAECNAEMWKEWERGRA